MMNLDDHHLFKDVDPQDMLAEIDRLPEQLKGALELGERLPLPETGSIERVVISGMGGSAIGADLLEAYARPHVPVPVYVHRDYDLPAWAAGPETLLVASSHSGNTEETLYAFRQAVQRGCRLIAVTTGGALAEETRQSGGTVWQFEHRGQPRAAVGYSFGLLLALFARLKLLPDPSQELSGVIAAMHAQQEMLGADSPLPRNPSKRLAGQLYGRIVSVFGAGILAPVARRWKGQISEVAKAWAQFEFLPEADHNTLAGTLHPSEQLGRLSVIFLQSPSDHPRNRLRSEYTRQAFMLEGLNTDFVNASGEGPLAHQWTVLQYGDYTAYYLAMLYGVDPTPVDALQGLKAELSKRDE
jgi:glucose/mannose-6-phosphate isomerase